MHAERWSPGVARAAESNAAWRIPLAMPIIADPLD